MRFLDAFLLMVALLGALDGLRVVKPWHDPFRALSFALVSVGAFGWFLSELRGESSYWWKPLFLAGFAIYAILQFVLRQSPIPAATLPEVAESSSAAEPVKPVALPPNKERTMNFSEIAKAIQLAAQLIPLITGFVQQAEATMVSATGSQKLAAVTASVNTYLTEASADAQTIQAVQSQVGPLTSALVAGFKAGGVFSSSQSAAA
jgi:hypothetical protein